jgi:hypothetical protein
MRNIVRVETFDYIDQGTPVWESARKTNNVNSSNAYDEFIGSNRSHGRESKIVRTRMNCLSANTDLNTEIPSKWVVENLFEPGKLGEKRFKQLIGEDIASSAYHVCYFGEFKVGVSPDGQYDGMPIEIKTKCNRNAIRWKTPLLKTHVQNMFQCIALGSGTGIIIRIEESHESYLDFTAWVVKYNIPRFIEFFASHIDAVEIDQTHTVDYEELKKCVVSMEMMPNQFYSMNMKCNLFENIRHLLD